MRNFLLLSLFLLIIPTVFSQTRPQKKIRKTFEQHAPQAIQVKWTGEGERIKTWTANYIVGVDSMQTKYDSKANWLYTLKFISLDQLPQNIKVAISDNYQRSKLIKSAEMQGPDFDGYGVAFIYLEERWAVAITKDGFVVSRQITFKAFDF